MFRSTLAPTVLLLTAVSPLVLSAAEPTTQGQSIAWFGGWTTGLAAAQQLNRPILLVAAAPHCHNVPGVW